MRKTFKTAIAALVMAGGAAVTVPASAQEFGLGIGPNGGISFSYDSGGYCDDWGCPSDFWQLPVYYGPVFYAGYWYDGPVYYRDWYGHRQYWIHGGWRNDEWRGPHPGWWREGRYGPALSMDYYRSHGFHGRWDGDRGNNFNRGYDNNRRDFNNGGNDRRDYNNGGRGQRNDGPRNNDNAGRDDRRDSNNGGGRGNFRALDQRGNGNATPAPQQNAAPQQQNQPQQGRQSWRSRAFGQQQQNAAPAAQPAPQAAPQVAPQQPPPDNGGDRGGRRHRDGN